MNTLSLVLMKKRCIKVSEIQISHTCTYHMQTPARNLEHAWNVIQDAIQGLLWPKQLWIIIVYVPDGEKRKHFSAQVHLTNHILKIKGSTCSLYQMIYYAVCWFIIRSSLTSTGGFNETSTKADKNVKYLDTKQAITKRRWSKTCQNIDLG